MDTFILMEDILELNLVKGTLIKIKTNSKV